MKVLVVYFTRTGNTEKVAREVAKGLSADIEGLSEGKDRSGVLGYLGAGRDVMKKKKIAIAPLEHDPAGYDLVVVGTPVWVYTMAPAVRTFLEEYGGSISRVAYFCTHGSNPKDTLEQMAEVGGEPAAVMNLRDRNIRYDAFAGEVFRFVADLRAPTTQST